MEWVASTLHTTSEHGVSSITTADAHTSAVSSRVNWRPCRFKWARPFRRKTKFGFWACVITFQLASTQWRDGCVGPRVRLEILEKKIYCVLPRPGLVQTVLVVWHKQNHRHLAAINRTKLMECWESAVSISTFSIQQRFGNLQKRKTKIISFIWAP